ncbi:MAG: hypothetical protein AAGC55_25025, partial [Myxococcota bacterium]
ATALALRRVTVEYLSGHTDRGRALFDQLMQHLSSSAERLTACAMRVRLELDCGRPALAIQCGLAGLRSVGVSFPNRISRRHLAREAAWLRIYQGRQAIIDFSRLPLVRDGDRKALMELLGALLPAAHLSDNRLYGLLILRLVRLSLRHGLSEQSIAAFGSLGALLAGHLHQFQRAHALMEVAKQLNTRLAEGRLNCRLHFQCGALIKPWIRPLTEAEDELAAALDAGRVSGDITYGAYAGAHLMAMRLYRGQDLASVQDSIAELLGDILYQQHRDAAATLDVLHRYCRALRDRPGDPITPWRSSGAAPERPSAPLSRYCHALCGAELHYLVGDYPRAWALSRLAERHSGAAFSTVLTAQHRLVDALIAAQRASSGRAVHRRQRRALVRTVRTTLATLRAFALSCPETYESFYALVCGEHARLAGDLDTAESWYQVARTAAHRQGAEQRAAIAWQLSAAVWRQRGRHDTARECERRAGAAYRSWGAVALVPAIRR